ncbi:Transcriptional activator protein acu-15 [Beauveria bassiana]|nr:Transcriptional activator protein acu-15 [Beauveria bassiana]KAH8720519.1 Transcriptional activator protein acu-15 [Beauveria bassiana]
MNAAHIFRQGLGTVPSRANTAFNPLAGQPTDADDFSDGEGSEHRVAHTLTACCRCRQRKTRCDPTLPRCLPCERSGSICEYLDAAKGRKINRYYVIKLQDKVRALEAELDHYTDEAADYPKSSEDIVRPGGMIRLSVSDEIPRYLGPSSGIALTRLLMEEAKRFTDSKSIGELIPEVRARRQARMQSIQMAGTGTLTGHKKSYPMVSEVPAEGLPKRVIANKLIDAFYQKTQLSWPVLHEKDFKQDVDAVYNGDTDPYRNFIVRMVFGVSLQKMEQYAGLADGYYMAAMQYFKDVVRPKDLKTLQCLVLVAAYSLHTPARNPIYAVIGLAVRICQQEGLTEEKTITAGYNLDAKTIDMRRRLVWMVATFEYVLSHYMGRPSSFAKGGDRLDVDWFATVKDENITANGITAGSTDYRKMNTIHMYKLRSIECEIRRTLYERKRPEPVTDTHPWYQSIDRRLEDWLKSRPEEIAWTKAWYFGAYHQSRMFLYRPSPQVPKPSASAAQICYDSAAFVLSLSKKQIDTSAMDSTWMFLLNLSTALNTLLWSISYPDVRQAHGREEVAELINSALDSLDSCSARWPGAAATAQLYTILSKACLQSYEDGQFNPLFSFASPSNCTDMASPPVVNQGADGQAQLPYLNPPQFGWAFDSPPETMNSYTFDPNFPPPQPAFRSNSIFCNPATDSSGGPPHITPPPPQQQQQQQKNMGNPAAMPRAGPGLPDQKPLPNAMAPGGGGGGGGDWYATPMPQFISPYNIGQMSSSSFLDAVAAETPLSVDSNAFSPAGQQNAAAMAGMPTMASPIDGGLSPYGYMPGRHGSLSQSQQMELMHVFEREGVSELDAMLNSANNISVDASWY